jgi:hypothetical protein
MELPVPSEVVLRLEESSNDENNGIVMIFDEEDEEILKEDQEVQQDVNVEEIQPAEDFRVK